MKKESGILVLVTILVGVPIRIVPTSLQKSITVRLEGSTICFSITWEDWISIAAGIVEIFEVY